MLVFASENVREIKEIGFSSEKQMQTFCEENMELLLNFRLVASEFRVADFRFDSVAYNADANSFAIIEYKNDKNFSVVDQGYSYISTMLAHKADFVLKYNQVFGAPAGLNDFDWTQVRVYFVAPGYTPYQLHSIEFKDLPMELWKIKRYERDVIQFEQIKPLSSANSILGYAPSDAKHSVQQAKKQEKEQPIVYTEDDRLADGSDFSRELYNEVRDYVLSLEEEIAMKPTKMYVGFHYHNHNLLDIKLQKSSIVIWLNTPYGTLDDPRGMITDVTHIGHHGNGACQIKLTDKMHMGYLKDLILNHYQRQAER